MTSRNTELPSDSAVSAYMLPSPGGSLLSTNGLEARGELAPTPYGLPGRKHSRASTSQGAEGSELRRSVRPRKASTKVLERSEFTTLKRQRLPPGPSHLGPAAPGMQLSVDTPLAGDGGTPEPVTAAGAIAAGDTLRWGSSMVTAAALAELGAGAEQRSP